MIYFKYLRYLVLHKWYVGLECWKRGLWFRAIVHDWSKFLPDEFIPYARHFYSEVAIGERLVGCVDNAGFTGVVKARRLSKHNNKFDFLIYDANGQEWWLMNWESFDRVKVTEAFDKAWLMHQHRQPHHWQHWILREDSGALKRLEMPEKDRIEMLCDWIGAGRAINPDKPYNPLDPFKETREWYIKNAFNIHLHKETERLVEKELGVHGDTK